jgi:hypothetical protein
VSAHITLRRIALALALVGLALRLAFALLPLQTHLIVLEDDAWMVTAIARNFALGNGITADGVNPTNGFQPLYPLTLGALPYLVAPNALDAGFTANLIICALLNALAAWPLWSLAKRFGGEIAGVIAVALFALNPLLIRSSVNAMETSLGLLLLLTLFAAFYALDLSRMRNVLLLALITALAVLARLDASLAFAAIAGTLAVRAISGSGGDTELGAVRPSSFVLRPSSSVPRPPSFVLRRLSAVILYVTTTLLLLAPYFAFNYAISGTFGPSSGAALAYMQSYRGSFNLTNGLNGLFLNSAVSLGWIPAPWAMALLLLAAVALCVAILGRSLWIALPLLLYLPAPLLYYGYLLQQTRARYFIGFSAILIIFLAWLVAELAQSRFKRGAAPLLAGVVALVVALNTNAAFTAYQRALAEPELTQPAMYQAALWMRENLPQGARIAAKNSGIYQYYSGHPVLNIDGKLNHEILPVLEQRALLDYVRARNIEYLVDRKLVMAQHIAAYSYQFGDAPPHTTPSVSERLMIYGQLIGARLGISPAPELARPPSEFTPSRPFSDIADIIQTFPRPNDTQNKNPVVVYRLRPAANYSRGQGSGIGGQESEVRSQESKVSSRHHCGGSRFSVLGSRFLVLGSDRFTVC